MKKITLLLLLLLAFDFSYGQTTLDVGDIAITGFISDDPDEFSFVLLTDVTTGTVINFTDNGWLSAGGFRTANAEGIVTWTANSDLSCGTEIVIEDTGSNIYSATIGVAIENPANLGFALNANGDQILAFQGTIASPTFLYAIHFASTTGWTNATDTLTSAIPFGLTDGISAIYLSTADNGNYTCTETAYQTIILAAVANPSNWFFTNNNGASRPNLGLCTFTCDNCSTTVTWNGSSWDSPPSSSTFAIIEGDYSGGNFNACSLWVKETFTLTVNNGNFIEVEDDVIVSGDIIVETQGNFVQRNSSGGFIVNSTGSSRVNKTTATKNNWFYYTYWSSPVIGETIDNVFPDVDGDRRFSFNAPNFLDTDGDDIDDDGNDWQAALAGTTMGSGIGYAVTEARLFVAPGAGTATFEGAFNTGDIPVTIANNPANVLASWNFIGNPYPSAIDFDVFHAANNTLVDGAVYFWSQSLPPANGNDGNEQINFNKNDYATYTVGSGGVAGASGRIPDQYIPSGQGFFINGISNGSAMFTNAMRMADATSNLLFFKGSNKSTNKNSANRLWVNLSTENGVFSQILVAYVEGATNGNDGFSYDAPKLVNQDYSAILYSIIDTDNKKYIIQGKNIDSINEDEIINLGFNSTIESTIDYTLSIAQFEGSYLTKNNVYLKDNLFNTLHNLSNSDYTFTSETGEFNNRFEILFNANALSTGDISKNANTLKIIELEDGNVQFTASKIIDTVTIFDLLGRQLYTLKGKSNSETYSLSNLSSSVYIAKVLLSNGAIVTKKAFKN